MSPIIAPADNAAQGRTSFRHIATRVLRSTGLVYLAYPFLVHWAFLSGYPQLAAVATALALVGLGASCTAAPWQWVGVTVLAIMVLMALVFTAALPLVFVPPVAINLCLAIVFARTLLFGREPLISQLARLDRGKLEPDLVRYTRRLTAMWVVFFVVMAIISAALATFGSRAAWAWFSGLGNYLLVAALLLGEYAYRRRRFAHYHHSSPRQVWTMVRDTMRRSA